MYVAFNLGDDNKLPNIQDLGCFVLIFISNCNNYFIGYLYGIKNVVIAYGYFSKTNTSILMD